MVGEHDRALRRDARSFARSIDIEIAVAAIVAEYIHLKAHVARSPADHARLLAATERAIDQARRSLR